MTKSVIAVDIDEVLSPLHHPFMKHHNKVYGTDFAYPDPQKRYYLEHFTGETSHQAELKIKAYVDHPEFPEDTVPLEGAVKGVKALVRNGFTLHILTGRQPFYREVTEQFLDKHFSGLFTDTHFIPHFPGSALSPAEAKVQICEGMGAGYIVDDNLGTARLAAERGLEALLFGQYHWNEDHNLPSGVTRCVDWNAVVDYFDGKR